MSAKHAVGTEVAYRGHHLYGNLMRVSLMRAWALILQVGRGKADRAIEERVPVRFTPLPMPRSMLSSAQHPLSRLSVYRLSS